MDDRTSAPASRRRARACQGHGRPHVRRAYRLQGPPRHHAYAWPFLATTANVTAFADTSAASGSLYVHTVAAVAGVAGSPPSNLAGVVGR